MENEHDIDHEGLASEAAAVELPPNSSSHSDVEGAPGAATTSVAPGAMPEEPAASWAPVTPAIVLAFDRGVCPNWKLTDEEKRDLADALAPVMDLLFPGGVGDERWAPYFRLLAVAGVIAATRFHDGRFTPMREPKATEPEEEGDIRFGTGKFTTAAGAST